MKGKGRVRGVGAKAKKRGSAGEERMKGGGGRAVGGLKQPDTQQKHTLWLLETFQHAVDTHTYTHTNKHTNMLKGILWGGVPTLLWLRSDVLVTFCF